MLRGINWIAVLITVVLLEALGFLWYGPLFGARWTAALGHVPEAGDMTVTMTLGVLNTIIIAVGLSWLIDRLGARSLMGGIGVALTAWFFFDFTTMAIDYLYVGHSAELVAINMGYQLVSYLLAGAILGVMRPKPALATA
ncbi:MAG TPA: DUF1761 domain-containing protein [Phenylobacterium sp.]